MRRLHPTIDMLFFFYGTLMDTRLLGAIVGGGAFRFVAEGNALGRLFDLGDYPGLVLDGAARVPGVVFDVDDAAASLLDDYEGVADGLYARRLVRVERASGDGDAIEAWTYEYLGSVAESAPIERWELH